MMALGIFELVVGNRSQAQHLHSFYHWVSHVSHYSSRASLPAFRLAASIYLPS